MKLRIFTLFLLSVIVVMSSCRKDKNQLNIAQYDEQQIQNYIATNHLTGFVKDTANGDSSGIYYQILQKPTTDTLLAYSDNISFVFTLKSFDGRYTSADTIENHYQGYLGHIVTDALPYGLEYAILNDLKHYGGSMRILIPSHLAYGVNGYGTGSNSVLSTHIAGNQCLDYYVNVISAQHDLPTAAIAAQRQSAYDYQVIKSYMASNSITSEYTLDSGVYYRIVTPPTGTTNPTISDNTTLEVTYFGRLLNNVGFDEALGTDSVPVNIPDLIPGVQRMLKKHSAIGETISMIMPSGLAYGINSQPGTLTSVPANSPLRFEFTIYSVTP